MRFDRKTLLRSALYLLVLCGVLELTLQLLAAASPGVARLLMPPWGTPGWAATLPDQRLGYRLNPNYPGLDRNGFSNPDVPVQANIITLGDSQSFPTGILPHQAWPRRLASLTQQSVYSFAVGGYGPVHSLILWDEAVALKPAVIVEALYSGNDLFDAFDLVNNRGQLPELKTPDQDWQRQVREAETAAPIALQVSRMFGMGREVSHTIETHSAARSVGLAFWGFLTQHAKSYGLLRRTIQGIALLVHGGAWRRELAFAATHPEYCRVFSTDRFKTVFTPGYRNAVLDPADPRIAEGQRIALRALGKMHQLAAARRIRFIVAFIPTKELVFSNLWRDPSPDFRALTDHETQFWEATKEFLTENGIEYVDALPVLQAQLARGIQPYHASRDGHPNEHGHRAIAELIQVGIQRAPGP